MSFSNGVDNMKSSKTASEYDMDKNDILYIIMFGILISLFLCLCCVLICVGRWAIAIVVVVIAIILIVVAALVYENNRKGA
jgi:cell division protein FtsW (lipid II flippase)